MTAADGTAPKTPLVRLWAISAAPCILAHKKWGQLIKDRQNSLASLGLVSPGAATDRCHPIFSFKKSDDLF